MERNKVLDILNDTAAGRLSPEAALNALRRAPFEDIDLGYARLDTHRGLRTGTAEVVYGSGKTDEQIAGIAEALSAAGQRTILVTRISKATADFLSERFTMKYYEPARMGVIGEMPAPGGLGRVLVVTAGTSDIPVAEEAAVTAEALGNETQRLYDLGVAGLHRILARLDDIMSATVIVAVAGMEGALASVLGGLADCPVIAVPTSVGYGASLGGLSALLSMLNSCSAGVSVVNIDNGFGAGFLASKINRAGVQGEGKPAAGNPADRQATAERGTAERGTG